MPVPAPCGFAFESVTFSAAGFAPGLGVATFATVFAGVAAAVSNGDDPAIFGKQRSELFSPLDHHAGV